MSVHSISLTYKIDAKWETVKAYAKYKNMQSIRISQNKTVAKGGKRQNE
jgi:hypothetical protein